MARNPLEELDQDHDGAKSKKGGIGCLPLLAICAVGLWAMGWFGSQLEEADRTATQPPVRLAQPSVERTVFQGDELDTLVDRFRTEPLSGLHTLANNMRLRVSEEGRQRIETALVERVGPLPASQALDNFYGYRALASLRPDNPAYKEKHAAYRESATRGALARLQVKEDKLEGVRFYSHPNSPRFLNSRSAVYPYIGRKGEDRFWLRLKIQYAASDWLFVQQVLVYVDGNRLVLHEGRFDRDNNTEIWEWVDIAPDAGTIAILQRIASSKEATLRFVGNQYRKDVTISAADKRAIRDILDAYEAAQL